MASIDNTPKGKYSVRPARVDMTPMVDLGFLLITFFMFTTRMAEDKALKYNTPITDLSNPIKVKCSKTITMQAEAHGKVKWIECIDGVEQAPQDMRLYDKEIRSRLLAKRAQMQRFYGDPKELFVIIKPDSTCSYQTLIDLIDELTITEVTRYTIVD